MSAGAPINIPAILDLSAAYQALGQFRSAASQPVTIGTAVSAGSFSTFAATGSAPFPASAVINAYQPRPTWASPFQAGGIPQAQTAGFGGAGGSQPAQISQLNIAVQQLTQAANAMASAARSGGIGPSGSPEADEEAGGSGLRAGFGATRGGVFGAGRLARFASLGYLAFQGSRLGAEYLQTQDENVISDARFGAGSPSALRAQAQSQQRFERSAAGYFPFTEIFLHSHNREEEQSGIAADEAIRDGQNQASVFGRREISEATRRGVDRQTYTINNVLGAFDRGQQGILNSNATGEQNFRAENYARQLQINAIQDVPEREREQFAFNTERRSKDQLLLAQRGESRARYFENIRTNDLAIRQISRGERGANLRARGNVGEAEEADFETGLQNRYASENESGRDRGAAQLSLNNAERRARANEIAFSVGQTQRRAEATQLQLDRRPLEASIAQSYIRTQSELREARNADEYSAIRENGSGERARIRKEFNDSTRLQSRRLDDSSNRLDILNDRTIDPFARDVRARSNDILTDVRNQSEDASKSGRGAILLPKIRENAEKRFTQERLQLLEGIQASSFDPTLTPTSGVGTFNLGSALNGLDSDKKRIAAEQAGGVGAAANGTPEITKAIQNVADILKAVPGLSDILNAINKLQGQ